MRYTTTVQSRANGGPCAICDRDAAMWVRSTSCCGLVVGAYACAEHETEVRAALRATTVQDVVATVRPGRRAARADAARRKADRLMRRACGHGQRSAALRGASSATHTHALFQGVCEHEADGLYALATALVEGAATHANRE